MVGLRDGYLPARPLSVLPGRQELFRGSTLQKQSNHFNYLIIMAGDLLIYRYNQLPRARRNCLVISQCPCTPCKLLCTQIAWQWELKKQQAPSVNLWVG